MQRRQGEIGGVVKSKGSSSWWVLRLQVHDMTISSDHLICHLINGSFLSQVVYLAMLDITRVFGANKTSLGGWGAPWVPGAECA